MQLQLPLGLVPLPWGGKSARGLTRGAKVLFLRREAQEDDSFVADPNQYDLFLAAIRGRPRYGGAPTMLPLPNVDKRRVK